MSDDGEAVLVVALSLRWPFGRGDIVREYRDKSMSTQVAVFTETIYGVGPAGVSTESLLEVFMTVEVEERGRGRPLWRRDEGPV